MVQASAIDQKPYRRNLMETWGAQVVASPSPDTNAGRAMLAEDPNSTGSLGMAISEAVEDAVTNPTPTEVRARLGAQSRADAPDHHRPGDRKRQLDMAGVYPDVVVGCIGGGSNFAGFAYPFIGDKLTRQGQ